MKSSIVSAENLMKDDKFKFGGGLYKIVDLHTAFRVMYIEAFNMNEPAETISLTLPHKLRIKIYNQ